MQILIERYDTRLDNPMSPRSKIRFDRAQQRLGYASVGSGAMTLSGLSPESFRASSETVLAVSRCTRMRARRSEADVGVPWTHSQTATTTKTAK